MPTKVSQPANFYVPPTTDRRDRVVWDRLVTMNNQLQAQAVRLAELTPTGRQQEAIDKLKVQIAAVQDQLTQGDAFVNAGSSAFSPSSVTIAASGDGWEITGPSTGATINVDNAATARGALGLGGLAVLNPGVNVPDSPVVAGVAYVQADFQSLIDTVNDLLQSLRAAGQIA